MRLGSGHDGVALGGLPPINATKGGPRERAKSRENQEPVAGEGHHKKSHTFEERLLVIRTSRVGKREEGEKKYRCYYGNWLVVGCLVSWLLEVSHITKP